MNGQNNLHISRKEHHLISIIFSTTFPQEACQYFIFPLAFYATSSDFVSEGAFLGINLVWRSDKLAMSLVKWLGTDHL